MKRLVIALVLAGIPLAAAHGQSDEKPVRKKPETRTRTQDAKSEKPSTSGQKGATQVATFGDWAVYTAQTGKAKICFAQSEPKSRSPASLKDEKAYLFVSFRPADNVRNEFAAVLNFKTKEDGPATLTVGQTNYDLVTKGSNAWLKNAADEAQAIGTMARGGAMVLQATSARGNKTSDRYSLTGFGQALERAKSECP